MAIDDQNNNKEYENSNKSNSSISWGNVSELKK